jgi:hypothetical protein
MGLNRGRGGPSCSRAALLPSSSTAEQGTAKHALGGLRQRTISTSDTPLSSNMRSGNVSSGRLATGSSTLGVSEAFRGYSLEPAEPASSTAVHGGSCAMCPAVAMLHRAVLIIEVPINDYR